jgi:segregation and condensation protein A
MSTHQPTLIPTLSNYQTRLPSFEGPMDVLLRLIERNRLEIADVSLIQLTDQFLDFVAGMTEAAPEVIAEFAMVGTRLTLLKSRSLLPRPPVVDEADEPNPGDLVHQLQAYKQLKEAARRLGERREYGLVSFGAQAAGVVSGPGQAAPPQLARYEPSVLIRSIRRRLSAVPQTVQTIRQRRIVSIREMIERVTKAASSLPAFSFSEVTCGFQSRSEVATAFLAVLVLIRGRSLEASQQGLFADIRLASTSAVDEVEGHRRGVDPDFIDL